MPQLQGYSGFNLLHNGNQVLVYRAVSDATGKSVIVKIQTHDKARPEVKRRLAHERRILGMLQSPFCPTPLDWSDKDRQVAIVLEDIQGEPLDSVIESRPISMLDISWL